MTHFWSTVHRRFPVDANDVSSVFSFNLLCKLNAIKLSLLLLLLFACIKVMHILTSLSLSRIKFNISILPPPVFWKRSVIPDLSYHLHKSSIKLQKKPLHNTLTSGAILLPRGDTYSLMCLKVLYEGTKTSLEFAQFGFAAQWPETLKGQLGVSKESKEIVGNDKLFQISSTRTGREDCWTMLHWTAALMVCQKLSYNLTLLTW